LAGKQTGILIPAKNIYNSYESYLNHNTADSAKALWNYKKGVIVCGYNGAIITRHALIIDALNQINNKLSDFQVVFPMAYGGPNKLITEVKEKLKSVTFDYQVQEEFLSGEKLMALRLAADIFVHIQARDQMASSMLEHLAAGSVVITGKWLPYDGLLKMGVYFILIETPDELPRALCDVIDNLTEHKRKAKVNRDILLKMTCWETIRPNWYKYYELEKS
jgi:hypothetical protein